MSRPVSHATVISAIVRKDLAEYGRDRLWAFLTVLVIVVVVVLFWILPDDVEEAINAGVSGLEPSALAALGESEEGLLPVGFTSESELRAVVAGEASAWVSGGETVVVLDGSDPPAGSERVDVSIGLAFPSDFLEATSAGRPSEVTVYVDGAVPDEIENAMTSLVREIAFGVAGEPLPVETAGVAQTFVVLGEDRAGNQVSARDGFRPIFVFLILMMEMFVMASLIAKEIQDRTVTAVLVTPATVGDVLAAKGIAGALSGLVQAVIVLLAINSLSPQPVLFLTLLLLGSVMISGAPVVPARSGTGRRDHLRRRLVGDAS